MKQILDWNAYLDTAVQAVAEGIVMLKNEHQVLPLKQEEEIAVFGRMQLHYYKSGTGSGGMVNVHQVVGILDGLMEAGIPVNQDLLSVYRNWDLEHPPVQANGWGGEPWSQPEMPLDDQTAENAAKTSAAAICIIARTAGEEQDNFDGEGSYRLYPEEAAMLQTVRKHFSRMIVLLNVGNLIDMTEIEAADPDAILYVWHGGMVGGIGTAKVLNGEICPSGKLPDTIAKTISDYPSDADFGNPERNFYTEDIYVGYRYFETFSPDKVRYPFGFGLSYTDFSVRTESFVYADDCVTIRAAVTNTGNYTGKETVQVYCQAPQGKLGKPSRILCGFAKTEALAPGAAQTVEIRFHTDLLASYDDAGKTPYRFSYLLEAGDYRFYIGSDVRTAEVCGTFHLEQDMLRKTCRQILAPVLPFQRIKPVSNEQGTLHIETEDVPMMEYEEEQRRTDALPEEIPFTGDRGIRLSDVRDKKATMQEFIAQLSEAELSALIRGEGMGSPKVTPGTAAAFGGITDALRHFGIPCVCCDDGPSGLRLDSGIKAFSLPIGTLLASTFNPQLIETLFAFTGLEMRTNQVDILLGPGMNIHRHPRNGRNFEYFSEDPLLTGKMGAAVLRGLRKSGVIGTMKHFCGNNQETNRHYCDNCISERALREIYLKGFEIAAAEGPADAIMTTYGSINGLWTAGSFDLNTILLREEWAYKGFTMTDWWANINRRGGTPSHDNLAEMVRAQNDIYMVCADAQKNPGNLPQSLRDGYVTLAELQRNAMNLCRYLMNCSAMRRLLSEETVPEIVGKPIDTEDSGRPIPVYPVDTEVSIPLSSLCIEDGKRNSFVLSFSKLGQYEFSVTASADTDSALSLYVTGSHCATFCWDAGSRHITHSKILRLFSSYTTTRMYIYGDLRPENISLRFRKEERFN